MVEPDAVAGQARSDSVEKSGSFAGDALKLAGGAALAQALGILASPILSRMFAPEAFGTTAVFVSTVQVISVVVCLRYELAIMLPEEDKDARNLLAGSLIFVGLFTLLTALGVIFLGEAVLELLRAPDLGPFLWMLPIAVLANGSYLALRYWNTRVKHFGLLSRVRVASSVGQVSTKLGMGFLGFTGPGSLIGAGVLGYIVSAAGLGWRTWRDNQHFSSQTSWRQIARQLERYRKFPLVSTWSGLLNTLSVQLPVMLLSVFFTQTVVGFYSFGMRMVGLPMTLIANAVGQVFFQRASEARNQGTLDLVVQSTYERLVKLGLFPLIVLGLIGPELFLVVFGPEWVEAGVYTQIVSLWRFFVFVGSPMSTLFSVLERLETGLAFNITLLITRVISLTMGGWLGNSRLALALYAGSGLVIWVGLVLWLLHASGVSIRSAALDTVRCLVYAAPVLLALSAAKWWWQWSAWGLVALAGLGALVYYGAVIRRDPALMEPLSGLLGRMRSRKA